jgi:ADP-heptose:LPS heptosyltransferase
MNTRFRVWKKGKKPRRILAIRYQAMGDVVITLPYLLDLKSNYPESALHFLTRKEDSAIPESIFLFDQVIPVFGGRNAKLQFAYTLLLLPYLWFQQYDVVLDLQNSRVSRILRKLLATGAWSEFDRVSPFLAGERTRHAIDAIQLSAVNINTRFRFRTPDPSLVEKMKSAGWDGRSRIVVLNPAGSFSSRNWPLENYLAFARQWRVHSPVQFMILGLPSLQPQAIFLKQHLGNVLIDLTGKTSPVEAFRLAGKAHFMLTEDGGLMHMAWVQGVPTLALFGSTRSDWSSPCGAWSRCLDSSDLPCGNCMDAVCQFGDVHCLTRYSPDFVFKEALDLLTKIHAS